MRGWVSSMAATKPIEMTDDDARILRDLVKALRNINGSGGIVVDLQPGIGLTIGLRKSKPSAPPLGGTCVDPLDLTYTGEHTEAAMTDSGWDREDQADNDGVKITLLQAVTYYHDGDEKIYQYPRDFTIDSSGRVKLLGDPGRTDIETPEDC